MLRCVDVRETPLGDLCPRDLTEAEVCPRRALRHRSQDGRCNNFEKPALGAAFSAFVRLLPARYADGTSLCLSSIRACQVHSHAWTPRRVSPKKLLIYVHTRALYRVLRGGTSAANDQLGGTNKVSSSENRAHCNARRNIHRMTRP